jgi:hypothetical protein
LKYWKIKGKVDMLSKYYDGALEYFKEIQKNDENNLEAIGNIGHCYFFMK